MKLLHRLPAVLAPLLLLSLPGIALSQDSADAPAEPSGPPVEIPPGSPGGSTVFQLPYAPPSAAPSGPGVNDHLPSSGRVSGDSSSFSDGFDLGRAGQEATVVRGSDKGDYVVSGQYVPETHTAKRGDTLWDISAKYFGNPYNWPRLWSYNRQITNPHWIYPGDHIKLRGDYGVKQVGLGVGFTGRKRLVPPDAVFLRNVGFVRDGDESKWGLVRGSPDDQMLLSENDQIYIELKKDLDIQIGQQLTIYEPLDVTNLLGADLVYIRGIAEVNRVNRKTGSVRATIIESLDVIERGALVGPIDRKIDIVTPKRNERTIRARIIGSLYPHQLYGKHQVVFIDKGYKEGVEVGNRFFAVRRGDEWRLNLKNAGNMADKRAIIEDDRNARVEPTPDTDKPELYPSETYAELLVVRTRKHTSVCVVSASIREIERGALLIARQGY